MPNIALLGTLDTKLEEILTLRDLILSSDPTSSTTVTLIDVGRTPVSHPDVSISQATVLEYVPSNAPHKGEDLSKLPRGKVINHMISCATALVQTLLPSGRDPALKHDKPNNVKDIHAIISAGGSGGTSLVSAVMRSIPIGFPKMIVSTVASGDTGPIVGETDISLVYSVVDIAGMNDVLHDVLSNAAGAIVGMAHAYSRRLTNRKLAKKDVTNRSGSKDNINIAISMFGVTTPCVETIRSHLNVLGDDPTHPYSYTSFVFHSTGHGGRAMERLIREGRINSVLDITTTEIADYIVGGVMSAGNDRLRAAAEMGLPQVISVGACDMVNFGPRNTVPEKFQAGRKLVEHNPTVTLMRTTAVECTQIGTFIAEQVKTYAKAPEKVVVALPLRGVSMISVPGQVFEDRAADNALFRAVREGLSGTAVRISQEQLAINDDAFAKKVVWYLTALLSGKL